MLEAFGFLRLSVDTLLYFSSYRFMTLTEITEMLVLLSSLQSILLSETACLMPSLICFYLRGILQLNGQSTNSFSACQPVTAGFGDIIRLLVIPFIEKVLLNHHTLFCGSFLLCMLQLIVIFLFTKKLFCSLDHAKNDPIACLHALDMLLFCFCFCFLSQNVFVMSMLFVWFSCMGYNLGIQPFRVA